MSSSLTRGASKTGFILQHRLRLVRLTVLCQSMILSFCGIPQHLTLPTHGGLSDIVLSRDNVYLICKSKSATLAFPTTVYTDVDIIGGRTQSTEPQNNVDEKISMPTSSRSKKLKFSVNKIVSTTNPRTLAIHWRNIWLILLKKHRSILSLCIRLISVFRKKIRHIKSSTDNKTVPTFISVPHGCNFQTFTSLNSQFIQAYTSLTSEQFSQAGLYNFSSFYAIALLASHLNLIL